MLLDSLQITLRDCPTGHLDFTFRDSSTGQMIKAELDIEAGFGCQRIRLLRGARDQSKKDKDLQRTSDPGRVGTRAMST
jgi:hypothetical protein